MQDTIKQDISANNKRIAKNTLLLYVRMLFMMGISLYTSRVVLATLGVSDFGIYNVVGGFVTLFTMISGTMATATQRFLSFEIGKGTQKNITRLFSTSMIIHLFIGCTILLLGETIGLWFVNYKMIFPVERITAVNLVYQFSIFTLIINVLSVPYNASIIAYEKMSAFAYIGILEAVLKLIVAYLIVITGFDKLIFYAFLLMIIAIGIRLLYGFYVRQHFHLCRCNWKLDREYKNNLLSFIGFNFIGSIANILKSQGVNVLLNLFFGTLVNAAYGISVQVFNAISGFVTNFQLALNPQIVKLYASGEKKEMFRLVSRGSKFSFLMMLVLSLPLIVETPFILNLWLVEVPQYTVIFVRFTLAIALVDSLSPTLITAVHATGNVKWYQIINGTTLMLTLPFSVLILLIGGNPLSVMIVSFIISVSCLFIRLSILYKLIEFPSLLFIKEILFRVIVVTIISATMSIITKNILFDGIIGCIITIFVCIVLVTVISFLIALTRSERTYLILFIFKNVKKLNIQ